MTEENKKKKIANI